MLPSRINLSALPCSAGGSLQAAAWLMGLALLAGPVLAQLDPQLDPELTSRTIDATGKVTATPTHPWAGFWKISCKDEFGLAFVAAKPGVYSVLFCGPFACTRPGTFQPDTPLVGDPAYRLDDRNQIGILDRNGNFRLHARCIAPR